MIDNQKTAGRGLVARALVLTGAILAGCGAQPQPAEAPAQAPPPASADASEGAAPAAEGLADEDAATESMEEAPRAAPAPEPASKRRVSPSDADEMASTNDLDKLAEQLSSALSNQDCGAAERFRDNICDLANKICEIAGELPSSHANGRCEDGKERCQQARQRVNQRCD